MSLRPAVTTPMVVLRCWIRLRARAEGRKSIDFITCRMRWRVSFATSGRLFKTRETVWVETPASRATCLIVARLLLFISL